MRFIVPALLVLVAACGGNNNGDGSDNNSDSDTQQGDSDVAPGKDTCEVLDTLGVTRVAIGAQMQDGTVSKAPFDVRYIYLAAGVPDGSGPCGSCKSSCSTNGTTCSGGGCGWWGCWQDTTLAPGQYVRDFVSKCETDGVIPMFSYYQAFSVTGAEGKNEVSAMATAALTARYFADYKFLLQQIGDSKAMLHIEPDFWGYTQSYGGATPSTVPMAVNKNSDCTDLPNDASGFARCLIKMTRKYAPNTLVGLHASGWASKIDVLMNTDTSLDVSAEAGKVATWLKALGAADGDFIVGDMCDRDAGYYETVIKTNKWWNTDATLPNFTQALAWGKAISEGVGRPMIWWQTPLGNASQTNKPDHYKDNRVDYLFAHMNDVAASGVIAVLFGTGKDDQTEPEPDASGDGGNFVSKVNAYAKSDAGKLTCE